MEAKPEDIVEKCKTNFKIDLNFDISFVYLTQRHFISAHLYPFFTLLGQSIGSIVLGFEALHKCVPNIFIDSMGYAFILPIFKFLAGSRVGAYVHYPTISTDMLSLVANTKTSYNNRAFISNSRVLTAAKLLYYKLFASLYGLVGRTADLVTVNSSWTQSHIQKIWKRNARIVYPPCNTNDFKELSLEGKNNLQIVSIGQFRPEKNHCLQIRAFKLFVDRLENEGKDYRSAKLVIIGSCRNSEDQERVNQLQSICKDLRIEDNVEFKLNIPYEELRAVIQKSSIGLHTMINEHFGIGVVECLAAGLITVAHNSGGPKLDIIDDQNTGFLANGSEEEFSQIFHKITNFAQNDIHSIRVNARLSVDRFSEQRFEDLFIRAIESIL